MTPQPAPSLTRAQSVTIAVHGVGLAEGYDLLEALERGATGKADSPLSLGSTSATVRVMVPELHPDESHALVYDHGGGEHWIIPFVWSGYRERVENELPPLYEPGVGSLLRLKLMSLLYRIPRDVMRCAPRASDLAWKLILLIVGILLYLFLVFAFLLTLGLIAAAFYGVTAALQSASANDPRALRTFNPRAIVELFSLSMLVVSLLLTPVRLSYGLFDFIADVTTWVVEDNQREARKEDLRRLIRAVINSTDAQTTIVLLGHSLGSVLASHAVHTPEPFNRRVVLATLGSPLRIMSLIFPGVVRTPERLLRDEQFTQNILLWWNAWRDQDFIGRSLLDSHHNRYSELALGSGPHSGYWSDPSVWEALRQALTSNGGLATIAPLSAAERRQTRLLQMIVWSAPFIAVLGLLCSYVLWRSYLFNSSLWFITRYSVLGLYFLGAVQAVVALIFALATVGVLAGRSMEERRRMDHLRTWRIPLTRFGLLLTGLSVTSWIALWLVVRFMQIP